MMKFLLTSLFLRVFFIVSKSVVFIFMGLLVFVLVM